MLRKSTRLIRSGVIALILAGVLVQIPGNFVNFSTQIDRYSNTYFSPQDGNYQFDFNPFPLHINELRELLGNLLNSKQRPEEDTRIHRSLEQINPDGILDFWWLQMWVDRVPLSFIATVFIILIGLILTGSVLIFTGFHLKRRQNIQC